MGKFIISLDFELHWGVFDMLDDTYNENILGARVSIDKMLKLFKKYDIHVTWAIVGFLFNEDKNDFEQYRPQLLPSYTNKKLNSYNCEIGENETVDSFHYAHSIIKLIKSYPNQEIASHSYSHYYCKEEGQTLNEFEEDIKSAIAIAKDKFSVDLKSFVFPRNEINEDYLNVLYKYGFTNYRSNPSFWVYQNGHNINLIGKIIRFLDSYFNVAGHSVSNAIKNKELLSIKGDRFLRPFKNKFVNRLMINRIKSEMKCAALNNKNYHLWWHPHNFGLNMDENMNNLENILIYYSLLKNKWNMESVCMEEVQ